MSDMKRRTVPLLYLMTVFRSQAIRTTWRIGSMLIVPPKYNISCTVACAQCRLLCSTFDLDDEKLACVIFRSNI